MLENQIHDIFLPQKFDSNMIMTRRNASMFLQIEKNSDVPHFTRFYCYGRDYFELMPKPQIDSHMEKREKMKASQHDKRQSISVRMMTYTGSDQIKKLTAS
uniref:Ycf1 n=1 Tax=Romanomermis culicivorax TaxID=13658 RepID=A0A915JKH2_ROMCU